MAVNVLNRTFHKRAAVKRTPESKGNGATYIFNSKMFPVVRSVINSLRTDTYQTRPGWQIICRLCSGTTQQQTEGEQRIQSLLKAKFPKATDVQVADISGGCGSMYEILLESEEFKGHRTIAQHRMVNEALKHELEDMHGLRISTRVPKDS